MMCVAIEPGWCPGPAARNPLPQSQGMGFSDQKSHSRHPTSVVDAWDTALADHSKEILIRLRAEVEQIQAEADASDGLADEHTK